MRKNPLKQGRTGWILGLAAGAAALAGGFWYYEKQKGVSVVATAGGMNVAVPKGQTLTVTLPTGATWSGALSFSGSGTLTGGTGSSPLIISNVQSGGIIGLAWVDAANVVQASTLSITTS